MYRNFRELEFIDKALRVPRAGKPQELDARPTKHRVVTQVHGGRLKDARGCLLLYVMDDFNPEGARIGADFLLPLDQVTRTLRRIIEWRGQPLITRVDHTRELIREMLL